MNKSELISAVSAHSGMSKVDSRRAVCSLLKVVATALEEGERVSLVGFGSFTVKTRNARMGVNPSTKEKMEIKAKKVVKFKASEELSDNVE